MSGDELTDSLEFPSVNSAAQPRSSTKQASTLVRSAVKYISAHARRRDRYSSGVIFLAECPDAIDAIGLPLAPENPSQFSGG